MISLSFDLLETPLQVACFLFLYVPKNERILFSFCEEEIEIHTDAFLFSLSEGKKEFKMTSFFPFSVESSDDAFVFPFLKETKKFRMLFPLLKKKLDSFSSFACTFQQYPIALSLVTFNSRSSYAFPCMDTLISDYLPPLICKGRERGL